MNTYFLTSIVAIGLLTSCKKPYTCVCFNPGGVFKTYKLKGPEKKAEQTCEEYSKEYQTIPWSETGCHLD